MKISFMSVFHIHQLYIYILAPQDVPTGLPEQHSKSFPSHRAWRDMEMMAMVMYPLVNQHREQENHHLEWENSLVRLGHVP